MERETLQALARRGMTVVAFDVAATAVAQARGAFRRHRRLRRRGSAQPASGLARPAFDLVVETLHAPGAATAGAPDGDLVSRMVVAPGGTLLVIAGGRESTEPEGEIPWPLTRAEVEAMAAGGPVQTVFDDVLDHEEPPVRRFRAAFVSSR